MSTDRIEKNVLINAPRSKVWEAIADSSKFGQWFGIRFNEPFVPGATLKGQITYKGYEHLTGEITVEEVVPERKFSMRWHPNAIDPNKDYSSEPTTLLVFLLESEGSGTRLTVTESGFDQIPVARRAEAYRGNERGWEAQVKNIEQYVTQAAQAAPQN